MKEIKLDNPLLTKEQYEQLRKQSYDNKELFILFSHCWYNNGLGV